MASLVSESFSSVWFAHPNRSHLQRKFLLASCTFFINTEIFADKKDQSAILFKLMNRKKDHLEWTYDPSSFF